MIVLLKIITFNLNHKAGECEHYGELILCSLQHSRVHWGKKLTKVLVELLKPRLSA